LCALVILCALTVLGAASTREAALENALRQAQMTEAVYRNAMHLYLRVAGVAWIVVEWIAAVLLWRSYRLLARAARDRGLLP
jgi:hypothetical protein